jgi:ArsR family transcriptional regulator, virulence genes transcriptional regulator
MLSDIKNHNDNKKSIHLKSTLLKALANHHRLLLIQLLSEKAYSVGQLEAILGISQSALSQHLAILRKNKIVKTRRSAQTIFYKLTNKDIMLMINRIFELFIQPEPSINIKDSARNYKSKNIKPPLF